MDDQTTDTGAVVPRWLAIAGIEAMPTADQRAITATLGQRFIAFAQRDAGLLGGVYTDDADWISAFGSVKTGHAEILECLRVLFAVGDVGRGRIVTGPACTLRRLGDDAVVILAHLQVTAPASQGSGATGRRDTRSVHVLARQDDGAWCIVTELLHDVYPEHGDLPHP